jgi:hypothetical protein
MALDRQGVPRPRCVGLIETCEESGSYDLLPYVDALRERLGNVALVVCLDSGAGNYEQLWMTTSLRGRRRAFRRFQRCGAFELPHIAPSAGSSGR